MIGFVKRCFVASIFACVVGAAPVSASTVNVAIGNAGFESALGGSSGNWAAFSSGSGPLAFRDTTTPNTGNGALGIEITGQGGAFAGVFQDVAATPGEILDLSFFAKAGSQASAFEARIEFRDSLGSNVVDPFTNNFAPTLTGEYAMYSLSDGASADARTTPDGAVTARMVFALQSFSGVTVQNVFVDDVSLTATTVPVPGPFLLLGSVLIAGVGFARRRRRLA